MTTRRVASAALATAALLAVLGVAPFCPPAEAMPCCSPADRCDVGMKAAGCCRVEPSPAAPHAPANQKQAPASAPRPVDTIALLDRGPAALAAVIPVGKASFTPLLPHRDPVPLYILDASILR